ncbi:hypothetical protein ACU4GR_26620 [Methylobacterium oryzae CBMB20]
MLRFWHLIEACLEPDLPSVRTFSQPVPGSPPRANLQEEGWEARIAPTRPDLFTGVLAHIDRLRLESVATIPDEAARAWTALKTAVIWPDDRAVSALSLGGEIPRFRTRRVERAIRRAAFGSPRAADPRQSPGAEARSSAASRGSADSCFP